MTLQLPARLVIEDAMATRTALLAQWGAATAGNGPVEVECSALKELDTAALAVLIELARRAGSEGRHLRLLGASAQLADFAALYGVGDILGLTGEAGVPDDPQTLT